MEKYRDINTGSEERAGDLLDRMFPDEKIAQLGSVFAKPLMTGGKFAPDKARKILKHGMGEISAPATNSALLLKESAELVNKIQKFLIEKTRLGIPAIVHEECLNGFRARGTTIFPQNIGLASTWEPELIKKITSVIRKQMRAAGAHQGLAPVLDVTRDPRWGRVEETFGEDPYLVARMGVAYVKGLQGEDIKKGIAATLKHFAGHGLPEGGLNCAPSHIPPRLLREVYLYPFEQAVKEGGVCSVMNAYHEIDGIPCAISEELLTRILREEWGFEGVVVSDYFSIAQLVTNHRIVKDDGEAAGLALKAGLDLELPFTNSYGEPLLKAVDKGLVPIELIDKAIKRILQLKFKLGLFEDPYADPEAVIDITDPPENRELALEAARKSIVLLKNENKTLPLVKNIKTIAVIGPNADSQRNLLGDYTYASHAGFEVKRNEKTGQEAIVWKDKDAKEGKVKEPKIITVLEGIKGAVKKGTKVIYAKGCEVKETSKKGFSEAVKAAKAADVAVVVVGDKSGLMPDNTSGEMRDRETLTLPGAQEELVKAIIETGMPVILVLVTGRPYVLKNIEGKIPAIISAGEPGEEGGRAVAEVIFGDYNPGGKLPNTYPETEGQIPLYYGHKPTGRKTGLWTDYVEGNARPLYPFGHGQSYTTFQFSNLNVKPKKITAEGAITVSVDVKNTGKREGEEVVQIYINDIVASVTRPVKELKAFQRVHLKAGEAKTVSLKITAEQLAFYNKDMERKVEAGKFKVMAGNSSENILLEGEFEVSGE
jgi:beta-glucosidase